MYNNFIIPMPARNVRPWALIVPNVDFIQQTSMESA